MSEQPPQPEKKLAVAWYTLQAALAVRMPEQVTVVRVEEAQ